MVSRARKLADFSSGYVSVATTGSVTLDIANNDYFDAGTLTGNTAITFGTPTETVKRFIYTFIPGHNNSAAEIDDITKWTFDNTLADGFVQSETFGCFNNDGTKAYFGNHSYDEIIQYTLSVPYLLSSANGQSETRLDVGPQESVPTEMVFNNDGTKLFVIGSAGDDVNTYTLSSAYDIATASHTSVRSVQLEETQPTGIRFNADGTKMYIMGQSGDGVDQYSLSSAFDPTTESHDGFHAFGTLGTSGVGSLNFNSDGTKVFMTSNSSNTALLKSYNLNSAYSFTSGSATAITERLIIRPDIPVTSVVPITLDRFFSFNSTNNGCYIERGSNYLPTFSTSFSGKMPSHYSRCYRHFLEFETHDTGSNYQLLNHRKVII